MKKLKNQRNIMTEIDYRTDSELSIETPGKALIKEIVDHITLKNSLQKDIEKLEKENAQKAEELKKESYEQGYLEGSIQGFNALIEISQEKERAINNLEECIFTLVKEISQEVIGESIKMQPESILPRIKRAIQSFIDHSDENIPGITLKVSSKDYKNAGRKIEIEFPQWKVIQDEQLMQGEAKIKTRHGSIDIQPTQHLKRILEHVSKSIRPPEEIESKLKNNIEMLHARWKGQLGTGTGHQEA
jgi:flagellar biosynthesis/type III secretory pathway protein FliH